MAQSKFNGWTTDDLGPSIVGSVSSYLDALTQLVSITGFK